MQVGIPLISQPFWFMPQPASDGQLKHVSDWSRFPSPHSGIIVVFVTVKSFDDISKTFEFVSGY